MKFRKRILIYIPCYNCENSIIQILNNIPNELVDLVECLIVDNQSIDSTSDLIIKEIKKNKISFKIHLIKTKENIGYAGSQKLAYYLAIQDDFPDYVIMLHGDGQYDPSLLSIIAPYVDKGFAIVNGFRDKKSFPKKEETPISIYYSIKLLSRLESLFTGFHVKEWYSGFVMYEKNFLKNIPLNLLSDQAHIDGEILICAGILKKKILSVPIYKKYYASSQNERVRGNYVGLPMIVNIQGVLFWVSKVLLKFMKGYYHRILSTQSVNESIDFEFDVIS